MKLTCTVICLSLFTFQGVTANVSSAKVKELMLDRNHGEKVFIKLDKHQAPAISCHTNDWGYVLDISDSLGKTIYSSLLTTYATGKSINFVGSGSCSLYPNIETLRRVELI